MNPDTESSLFALLAKRYQSPEWALFGGVRNRAGYDADRTADAMAMSLWPSRGLRLHGFEIKCCRSDWLTELRDPSKAEAFSVHCDHWWLVTSPGVVQGGELPPAWGLLERKGTRLVCVTEAPKADPKPLPRSMLAAMCKRIVERGDQDLKEAEARGEKKAHDQATKYAEHDVQRKVEAAQKLSQQVAEFEEASGVNIRHNWEHAKLGAAVRALLGSDVRSTLERERNVLTSVLQKVDTALAELATADGPVREAS